MCTSVCWWRKSSIARRSKAQEEQLRETIAAFAESYENPQGSGRLLHAGQSPARQHREPGARNQVVDWVLSQVQVTDRPKTFARDNGKHGIKQACPVGF